MKTQFPGHHQNELATVSLKQIVARLITQWQPIAVRQHSFIVNDIPGDFHLKADSDSLAAIISALLNSVISRTANNCIRISVKRFNDIVLLRLKDSNTARSRYSQYDWQKINSLAAKIGGCIVENGISKNSSVTLSFHGLSVAA